MVLRTCAGATCHVSWWQGTRRPVRLISNHLNIHEQQLSGPRPLRCCTPAQPANISLTQHQAGGQDADDEDVTTPQNYYVSCFLFLYWYWPHPHLVPALVAGDHSQVPIKHISASPRTQSGSAGYSCTQNDGRLTGSLLTNFLVYSPV